MELLNNDNLFTPIHYTPKRSGARGQRACIIEDFCTELNKTVGQKYKHGDKILKVREMKPAEVAFRLSHLNVGDLYYFLSSCRQAKCPFRQAFFGGLKKSYPQRVYKKV